MKSKWIDIETREIWIEVEELKYGILIIENDKGERTGVNKHSYNKYFNRLKEE